MAQRALNKVQLIGNLTRDPELRYTPSGTAVCTFGLATNRTWVTDTGEKRDDVEFHRLVAWNKLAEICSQLLFKGRRIYIEGRLQTRQWTGKDGVDRQTTEVVVSDMIILDSRRAPGEIDEPIPGEPLEVQEDTTGEVAGETTGAEGQPGTNSAFRPTDTQAVQKKTKKSRGKTTKAKGKKVSGKKVKAEDIPF